MEGIFPGTFRHFVTVGTDIDGGKRDVFKAINLAFCLVDGKMLPINELHIRDSRFRCFDFELALTALTKFNPVSKLSKSSERM